MGSNLSALSTEPSVSRRGSCNTAACHSGACRSGACRSGTCRCSWIAGNRRVVLIDFGMSIYLPEGEFLKTVCGSPHYVAPEVIE